MPNPPEPLLISPTDTYEWIVRSIDKPSLDEEIHCVLKYLKNLKEKDFSPEFSKFLRGIVLKDHFSGLVMGKLLLANAKRYKCDLDIHSDRVVSYLLEDVTIQDELKALGEKKLDFALAVIFCKTPELSSSLLEYCLDGGVQPLPQAIFLRLILEIEPGGELGNLEENLERADVRDVACAQFIKITNVFKLILIPRYYDHMEVFGLLNPLGNQQVGLRQKLEYLKSPQFIAHFLLLINEADRSFILALNSMGREQYPSFLKIEKTAKEGSNAALYFLAQLIIHNNGGRLANSFESKEMQELVLQFGSCHLLRNHLALVYSGVGVLKTAEAVVAKMKNNYNSDSIEEIRQFGKNIFQEPASIKTSKIVRFHHQLPTAPKMAATTIIAPLMHWSANHKSVLFRTANPENNEPAELRIHLDL